LRDKIIELIEKINKIESNSFHSNLRVNMWLECLKKIEKCTTNQIFKAVKSKISSMMGTSSGQKSEELRSLRWKRKSKMELLRSLCIFILFAGFVSGQDGFRLYMTKVYIKHACNKVRIRVRYWCCHYRFLMLAWNRLLQWTSGF